VGSDRADTRDGVAGHVLTAVANTYGDTGQNLGCKNCQLLSPGMSATIPYVRRPLNSREARGPLGRQESAEGDAPAHNQYLLTR
jgi:hypothetical protein